MLYMRWSKKTADNFHTDSMSVVECLVHWSDSSFTSQVEVMHSRTLKYMPVGNHQRTGSDYGSYVRCCHRPAPKGRNCSAKDECMSLASSISVFEKVVCDTMVMGKVGMRSGLGQTKSQRRLLGGNSLNQFLTTNLLEFHKPESFATRIYRSVDHLNLAFCLCQLLFPRTRTKVKRTQERVYEYSCILTEGTSYRRDFLTILAGICLNFRSLDEVTPDDQKKYFDDGIKEGAAALRSLAKVKASSHLPKSERLNRNVTTTFARLNDLSRGKRPMDMHFHGMTRNTEKRARQYLLVKAKIFELWLESRHRETLKTIVLEGLNSNKDPNSKYQRRKRKKHASRDAGTQACATECSSNQEEEETSMREFAMKDMNEREAMRKVAKHSVFGQRPKR